MTEQTLKDVLIAYQGGQNIFRRQSVKILVDEIIRLKGKVLFPAETEKITAYVHTATIRLYCSCGDADIIDGSLEGVSMILQDFAAKHHGEGHSPCTPRQAAAARRRKSRGLPPPQPIIPEGQAELFHLRPRKV